VQARVRKKLGSARWDEFMNTSNDVTRMVAALTDGREK
jgi:hypothetical protein